MMKQFKLNKEMIECKKCKEWNLQDQLKNYKEYKEDWNLMISKI